MNCDKCGKEINRGMAGSEHAVYTPTRAEVGMRVYGQVEGDDDDGDPVYGTITNVEPLIVEETGYVLSEHFPTIKLDDGRTVNGMECWWSPVSKENKM